MDLEHKTIEELKAGECSVERALLVVSGLDERGVSDYERKLDRMQDGFTPWRAKRKVSLLDRVINKVFDKPEDSQYNAAQALFDYLWETKPQRCNGNFLLAQVIDAQLDEDKYKAVGNGVGLTSLYSVLGSRLGLDLAVLYNEIHILSLLLSGKNRKKMIIENTELYGFDSVEGLGYEQEDLLYLVSDVFNSRGVAKINSGYLLGALHDYDTAIELKPDYVNPYYNRGNVKIDLGDFAGAIEDYNTAIELKSDYANPLYNRGVAKKYLGDLVGAKQDFDKAIRLQPNLATAFDS
ncbi:MAG: tetratricopeptide repeat protein [Nanoarchaeota archaeon]